MAGRAGDYGYTWTGTMFVPGPVSVAAVGRVSFDDAGNMWGRQTVSRGGTITEFTLKGTYTIERDCTGTITVEVYTLAGSLSSTATWATVSVNNMEEAFATMTSMVAANGTVIPVAIASEAKKLDMDRGNGHASDRSNR
jgi:hypothetical protein